VEAGEVRPIIHARFPLAQAAEAHRVLASSTHIGKVLLTV
jgi:NADPH:quinone reductase-like Zn-dependent oxidoreductase